MAANYLFAIPAGLVHNTTEMLSVVSFTRTGGRVFYLASKSGYF